MTEIKQFTIIVPEYPEMIKLSEKRRPKYYLREEEDKLPKKYSGKYYFTDNKIYSLETHEPILKNTVSVGTPRYERVNFQKLWNGTVARHARAKMSNVLGEFYSNIFREQLPKDIQIEEHECFNVRYDFYNVINGDSADLDNLAHWHIKTSLDILTKRRTPNEKQSHKLDIIEDDSLKYIRGVSYYFTECEKPEDRKLVITLSIVPKTIKIC